MSLKLNHVHLKTKDPEKTAKFYVDTLGATIVNRPAATAIAWICMGYRST